MLGKDAPPALTVVGVSALPEAAMRVMIEGTAQLRSEFPDRNRMRPGS
ncbi:MAG: RidA family protein [Gemmatimonadetes bacterium]|nr:RidA family protein [Gemmatimonadota bacterium]